MTKTIKFIPSSLYAESTVPAPVPTRTTIPEYYKSSPRPIDEYDREENSAKTFLKNCVPFRDAFMMGYVQKTWSEILVEEKDNDFYFTTRDREPYFGPRSQISTPVPFEYHNVEMVWRMPWFIELPKGYSLLVTHPLNRHDLPFFTLNAVIDSDTFIGSPHGSIPFYVRKDFVGVLPVGTPMYQLIPFKRDNWQHEIVKYSPESIVKSEHNLRKFIFHSYQRQFWQKKNFN